MEKPPATAQPQLTPQDWETLIDDFSSGDPSRRSRWLPLPLLDLALSSLLRPSFPSPLKPHLLLFLESSSPFLFAPSPLSTLPPLLSSLRSLLLSPSDPPSLKDLSLLTSTSICISSLPSNLSSSTAPVLDPLIQLLLSIINRPNHGVDRQSRGLACECLRELEIAFPLLLSDAAGHLWSLAQSERTHASQSYLLLLAAVINHIAIFGLLSSPSSVLSTSVPLVPFVTPSSAISLPRVDEDCAPSDVNLRDVRRVIAFLLERPQALTPNATLELVDMMGGIAGALERHVKVAALLKVQFSGLLSSYDPLLCHVVLLLYSRFSDAFSKEDERAMATRLGLIPKEAHQPLVFRLLALHWLLGCPTLADGKEVLAPMVGNFYPSVFDPLALKAAKMDALACVAVSVDDLGGEGEENGGDVQAVKLFEDGLVCVSAFKWLPPWSTETAVAFRALHKFLIGVAPHRDTSSGDNGFSLLVKSTVFNTLQSMLVKLALEHRGLVGVIASFVDRLLKCKAHQQVGERLLQTFDEHLLPKLEPDYRLVSYFPIFERIAENDTVPPRGLVELLTKHMAYLAEKHDPDTGMRSWSQGSKVLGICRLMLMHHHSSRIFLPLSHLLSFTCQSFPDLEVRDDARIYLRMLVCIPGKKLRHILSIGGQLPGVSPSPGSFFPDPSPRLSQDPKKSSGVSSYIHLKRVIPLLVKQSWSLTLPDSGVESSVSSYYDGIGDIAVRPTTELERDDEAPTEQSSLPQEPLRVVDSKVAEILGVLRRHFACIPDYRYMPAIIIKIPCILSFEAETFSHVWGHGSSSLGSSEVDGLPALYATTITFSSTAKYGKIPPCRVPFLLGEPPKIGLDIVSAENDLEVNSSFQALVTIELEPREPMPGLIDVGVKANVENGQIISGPLQSISVGIEDMFLKASIHSDVAEDGIPDYYLDLFHALWEACGNSANTGRETFPLSGGKGAAAISGTRSVKLLEVSLDPLIGCIERYLAPFVVSVIGVPLVNIVKGNGVIRDVVWGDDSTESSADHNDALVPYSENIPPQIQYGQDEGDTVSFAEISKKSIGVFLVLIFLPPRFHLLFQMEVGQFSTLVRIRTDHWPCLAYIDDYLESLFLT